MQVTELNLGSGVADASLWKLKYEYGEINSNGDVDPTKNTGNIARLTTSFSGLSNPFVQTFKYDSLYRLTEAKEKSGTNENWKELFSYDRYGNRIGYEKYLNTVQQSLDNKTHPSINPQTNRFNTNQGYTYDLNGNLISDAEGRNFTFNGDNKQSEIRNGTTLLARYFYDGEGKRIKKLVYNPTETIKEETVFVYDGLGKLIAEYSTAIPPQNPTTSYTATDMLGSPRVITDSQGNVTSRRDFMPFGEELANDPNYRTAALKYNTGDSIRQKFTGYQKDEETNLDFAEARMYENRHARFTAVDPLLASGKSANPQTFNRYVYVMNNPLIYTDPGGLQAGWYANRNILDENGNWSARYFGDSETIPDGYTLLSGGYDQKTNVGLIGWIASKNMFEILHPSQNLRATTASLDVAEQQLASWQNGEGLLDGVSLATRSGTLLLSAGTVGGSAALGEPTPFGEILLGGILVSTTIPVSQILLYRLTNLPKVSTEAGTRDPRVNPDPSPAPSPTAIPLPAPPVSSSTATPTPTPCPVCRGANSGNVIPPGTMGYRPLDNVPNNVFSHGVWGPHHNVFRANQIPPNAPPPAIPCSCFWQKMTWAIPPPPPPGWVPVEPLIP